MHQQSDYQQIEAAIRYWERNQRRRPAVSEIAAHVGVSTEQLERLFRRWAGAPPHEVLKFITPEHLKQSLWSSSRPTDAADRAGRSKLAGGRRPRVNLEAFKLQQSEQRESELSITYGLHSSPFGRCLLALAGHQICILEFFDRQRPEPPSKRIESIWPRAQVRCNARFTQSTVERIFECGQDRACDVTVLVKGTPFQLEVWQAMLHIPPGALASYQELACALGQPKSARAVGAAVGRNSVAYLIPCHRVIHKAGSTGNYRWGSTRKKALIAWEAAKASCELRVVSF